MRPFILYILASAALPACQPVAHARIFASDLALADSRYSGLPSTLFVGFNAEPGKNRTLTAAELNRLAVGNGLHVESPTPLCFEFPVKPLSKEDVIAAMRRSLLPGASFEVLELQHGPVPEGALEFPLPALDASGVWRGFVRFAESNKVPVWARVALHTEPPAVHRGDPVRVEVRSGAARLHFDAVAEAPASAGATVELRNPINGKTFKARLDSPRTAIVDLPGGHSF